MKIAEADILIVPGLGNSGPGHWQHRWGERLSTSVWVEQRNWNRPKPQDWIDAIEREVIMATRPVVLIGHSVGVHAIVQAARHLKDAKVRGAFLVAVPDIEMHPDVPAAAKPFAPVPRDPLPFPSMLVASSTDPYCSVERAVEFANCWGSDFHIAGESGHINAASGHGPWPEGLMMFTRLMQRIKG